MTVPLQRPAALSLVSRGVTWSFSRTHVGASSFTVASGFLVVNEKSAREQVAFDVGPLTGPRDNRVLVRPLLTESSAVDAEVVGRSRNEL